MAKVKLSEAHKQVLAELYRDCPKTRDQLPYTAEFDAMHAEFLRRTERQLTKQQFWVALASAGKASRLNRKER